MSAAGRQEGEGQARGKDRKEGNPLLGILVIAITLALTAFSYHSYANNAAQGRGKALLHAAESLGPSSIPLHVSVSCEEGGVLAVKASLRDLGGREIALQSRAFRGTQLSIDFLLVPAGKAGKDSGRLVLAFPRSIYSDVLPQAEGMRLLPTYADGTFPGIFDGSPAAASLSSSDRKAITVAMETLARADADPSGTAARSLGVRITTLALPVFPGSFEYDLEAKIDGSISAKPIR